MCYEVQNRISNKMSNTYNPWLVSNDDVSPDGRFGQGRFHIFRFDYGFDKYRLTGQEFRFIKEQQNMCFFFH